MLAAIVLVFTWYNPSANDVHTRCVFDNNTYHNFGVNNVCDAGHVIASISLVVSCMDIGEW